MLGEVCVAVLMVGRAPLGQDGSEPQVPGLGGFGGLLIAQHLQRLVGEVFGQVVSVLGSVGLFDEPVVLDQVGVPLVGLAVLDPVGAQNEQPLPKRLTDPGLSNGLIESVNTKIRLLTRIAFGFANPDPLIALAMLALGGHRPTLPGPQ